MQIIDVILYASILRVIYYVLEVVKIKNWADTSKSLIDSGIPEDIANEISGERSTLFTMFGFGVFVTLVYCFFNLEMYRDFIVPLIIFEIVVTIFVSCFNITEREDKISLKIAKQFLYAIKHIFVIYSIIINT